MYIGETLLYYS